MRILPSITIALAALAITACDNVKFPGAGPRDGGSEQQPPPPPNAPISAEEAASAGTSEEISGTESTNVSTTPTEISGGETEVPANTEAPAAEPEINRYAGVDNLLSINAARCAPTTAEASQTLAEIASASRVTSGTFSAQAVNGTAVTTAAFPGIVKMEPKRRLANGGISSGHCGATRIANNWFITASHCLDDTYDDIDLISTEASLLDPRAVRIQATASLCHAAYGGATGQYANDVALIKIDDAAAAQFEDVPIARFGQTEKSLGPINYPLARMAGWGITSFDGGELSNDLLTTILTLVSSGPAAITVASLDNAGPCIGDSGGPLLIDEDDGLPRVVGVLSVVEQNRATGKFCEGSYNARYTNLQGYISWVQDVIGVCETSPELCAR